LGGTGSVGFATTGAFSETSGSASSRLTQIEQVYATTGSNSFRATQSITGSLTVTGQIIAQTLNVQQVTSSIVYSSGSNTFGCDLNSRQTFTGSFYQTGSVACFSNTLFGNIISGNAAAISGSGTFGTCMTNGDFTIISNSSPFLIRGRQTFDRGFLGLTWDISPDAGIMLGNSLGFNINSIPGSTIGTRALTLACNGAATFVSSVQANGAFRQYAGVGYYSDFAYNGTTYNLGSSETTDNIDFKIAGGGSFTSGGNFRWFTQAGGSPPIQALRITPSGNLEIGTSTKNSFSYLALINDANTNGGVIAIARTSGQFLTAANPGDMIIGNSTGENILFGNGQTGTTEYMRITSAGGVAIGITCTLYGNVAIKSNNATSYYGLNVIANSNTNFIAVNHTGTIGVIETEFATGAGAGFTDMAFKTCGIERVTIKTDGDFLVGATTNSGFSQAHRIKGPSSTENTDVLSIDGGVEYAGLFRAVSGANYSTAGTAIIIGRNSSTGRSINAGGTINASGADYAEYMLKATEDTIEKGDIVGVNSQGKLTNIFEDSVSFVVKSTDPSYVGGDTWGSVDNIGKLSPEATEEEKTAYNTKLETERAKVDRIAFSGQVPCNVTGANVGDYIIPIELENGKIGGQAVSNPTLEQYRISVGKVWKIMEDGRAWIAVKIG
jgi:hypothetical protein